MKKLFWSVLFGLAIQGQVGAVTQPDDLVKVNYYVEDYNQNPPIFQDKIYTKKWKDIKIAKETKDGLLKKNTFFDKNLDDNYHIGFIMIVNDKVQRITFHGDRGNVVMLMWPEQTYCYMNLDGNGMVPYVKGNQCYSSSGKIGEE